jgi:hypothetical protein
VVVIKAVKVVAIVAKAEAIAVAKEVAEVSAISQANAAKIVQNAVKGINRLKNLFSEASFTQRGLLFYLTKSTAVESGYNSFKL